MKKRILGLLLCLSMIVPLMPLISVEASANIKIDGVDIGYAVGEYFSKNGKACTCHNKGLCVPETSKCNCKHVSGGAQCYGFALWCENKLYGYNDKSNGKKFESFGYVAEGKLTKDKLKELIGKAKIGAHIRTNSSKPHSMILYAKSNTGFSVVQANGTNNNTLGYSPCRIGIATYTWDSYFTKGKSPYGKRGIAFIKQAYEASDSSKPVDNLSKDSTYKTPISCIAYKKMNVYYSSGNQDSGHYISAGDACTIDAVYTNGLCSVTYPTVNGNRDAYAKFKDFTPNPVSVSSYKAEKAYTTYTHSDKKNKYGSLSVNDACTVVGQTGNMYQLIYPVKGGYKLGWIDKNGLKDIVKPTPEPNPTQVTTAPLPVAKGFFKGKKVVFAAPKKINLDDGHYISAGDICTIEKMIVNDNGEFTGECKVKYPTNGYNDVFADNCTTRTVTVAISKVLTKYNENYEVYEVPKAIKKYSVYPANKKDAMGHTWYVSKGDKFYTIATSKDADSNKMTEVMYPCTEGTHKGYWKLGWIYLDYFYLDLNGYLDGAYNGTLSGYGYADITVNNEKITKVQDYYKQLPAGSTYSIKNPIALARHTYNGVKTGSLSGTVTAKTQVQLNFTTNPPVLQDIYISSNPSKTEYLEGEWLDTAGLSVTARYDDASTQDVTGSCGITGYDSSPGLKTVNVSFGGYETAFTVNVKSKSPTQIEIVSLPNKTVYNTGDEIDLTGLIVKATYDNGTSAIVDDYDVYIDEGATAEAGQVNIDVLYIYNEIEQYASFDITVNQKYTYLDLGDDFTAYIQYTVNGKYVTRIENDYVRLWSENGSLNQIWHFIKQDGESYKIVSMAADDFNVLDVSGWGTTPGTGVGTYYDNDNIEENSTSNQRWYIIQSENGYRLKPQCSECVLDVAGGGDAADGTNIQMNEYLSYGAQEFNINKIVLATDISIDKTNITLGINETANINVTVQPDDAVGQNIVWTSSNEAVATVDNGTVTAKGLGSATITAKTLNGKTAECIVNVQDSVTIGDVNGDGEVDIADAILVMKHDAGLTVIDDTFNKAADVNQDGEIDIADAILIMKYDAGLIDKMI